MRLIAITLISLFAAACQRAYTEQDRIADAERYLAYRGQVTPQLRAAILAGKVTLGMAPDEARAAAGACVISITPIDPKWGEGTPPMQIAMAQRTQPDSSKIMMRFWTTTQFNSKAPWGFNVHFERGRAVRIIRDSQAQE